MPNPGDPWGCPKCGSFNTIWVEIEEVVRRWPAIHSTIGRPEFANKSKSRARRTILTNRELVICNHCGFFVPALLGDGSLNPALQSDV